MLVMVLGGGGTIGFEAAKELTRSEVVSHVYIAELNVERAKKLCEKLGEKASVVHLDVTDREELIKRMRDTDLVINCVGPFYKFGVPVVRAAVEAGVNYIDIMDDPYPTQEILSDVKLNEAAKDKEITVIIGLGSTPGLTNMLAKYGANMLDEVDRIDIGWASTTAGGVSPAVLDHMMNVMSKAVTYENGQWVEVKPLIEGKETVDFLELGDLEVYHIGHPEPISIPRYIKGVKSVTCKMGMVPTEVLQLYRILTQLQLTESDPIKVKDALVAPRDFMIAHLSQLPLETQIRVFRSDEVEPLFEFRVMVNGRKNGDPAQYIYKFSDVGHEEATYIPLAVAAMMLGREEVKVQGVFAPEGALDPEPFLREVIKKGITLYQVSRKIEELP